MIEIRPLAGDERDRADAVLPLHRLDRAESNYLVAWDGDAPVGQVCIEWTEPPELQDLWVVPERRRDGVGRALIARVELEAATRGHRRLLLSVGAGNDYAVDLYRRLGYVRTASAPRRIKGTISLRGKPFDIDDTLLDFEKAVDSGLPRSS